MNARTSLNGGKTRPLTAHALEELGNIAKSPVPQCAVNPGVTDRLLREDLVTIESLLSPYKVHKGGKCPHLVVTDAGRFRLRAER